MMSENAFEIAMGDEVEEMPHDYDSLKDWAYEFLKRYRKASLKFLEEDLPQYPTQQILGYELRLTCSACPEQYNVFKDGESVAYLRLRHGGFRAEVPDCGGEQVYSACPQGDGVFTDNERRKYLTEAIEAIDKHYASRDSGGKVNE